MPKLPAHGTVARYRRELREKKVCDRCRAANTKAKSRQRARAKQRGARPILSIVPDVQSRTTPEPTTALEKPTPTGYDRVPAWGRTRKAVEDDLKTADASAPFFSTLKNAALVLADEIDSVDGRTSKAPLVKQLVDVVRELKGKDEASGNSFQSLLAELGRPLVAAPTLLDETESG